MFKFTHPSFDDFLREACPERKGRALSRQEDEFDLNMSNIVETVIIPGHSAACDLILLCFNLWSGIGRFRGDFPHIWEQRDKFPIRIITAEVADMLKGDQ